MTMKELQELARVTGKSCGFDMTVDDENGSFVLKTKPEHGTSFVLKKGSESKISTFMDGMEKGCKSMYFTETNDGTKRLMNDFSTLLNRGTARNIVEPMFEELLKDHRTLQQSFWRVINSVCEKYADAPFDARNEGSVNFCKMVKGIGNGKILGDAATDCLETFHDSLVLKKKCHVIREKYKNKTIVGLCKDIGNFSAGSKACGELTKIALESNVPVQLPFM